MKLLVAPKWILEPVDSSVTRGQSLSIDCSASGYPMPRVIWTKANGQLNSNSNFGLNANLEVKSQQLGSWVRIICQMTLEILENLVAGDHGIFLSLTIIHYSNSIYTTPLSHTNNNYDNYNYDYNIDNRNRSFRVLICKFSKMVH